ncbi:MAG: hypothetical protein JWP97_3474 [Labilithrix sp.]|nr:hypothetical protein [Labilithrix sp.]
MAGAGGCFDFTYEPSDAGPASDAPTSAGCPAGAAVCGGAGASGDPAILYRCAGDGGASLVAKCASGCIPAGEGARCGIPATPCVVSGLYCGGDKLDGDPAVLYRCGTGGTAVEKERCAKGCQVAKGGTDDDCVR